MCPNALSPSLCCSSISGTCSSHTTIVDIHTPPHQHEENNNPINNNNTFLLSLSSHLDLLAAGSLFLLPSLLPYLASALTADSYSPSSPFLALESDPLIGAYGSPFPARSPELVSGTTTTTTTASSAWTWSTTWIMMLPCLGVIAPMSLFKLLAVLEERSKNKNGIECPYKRWRQSRAATRRRTNTARRVVRQSNSRHGAVDGPTLQAIKRAWRNLMRTTTTSCVDDDNSRVVLGYAPLPLAMAYQDEVSAEEGRCEKSMHPMDNNNVDFCSNNTASNIKKYQQQHQQRVSTLPRPKTILLASLWAWTLLMTLSAKMGFNSLDQTSVPPSFAVSSPVTRVPTNAIVGGSSAASGAPIFILPSASPLPADLQLLETDDVGQIDLHLWEPTSDLWSTEHQQQEGSAGGEDAMVAPLDMDFDV
ncbi:hypothetical protein BGZ95_012144, partial [Linnemannia exigua]